MLLSFPPADFDAFKNDKTKNPTCDLKSVGRVQLTNTGGPATVVDTSVYCTSLIKHVLDIHMQELIDDGRIEYLWHAHLRSLENKQNCGLDVIEETNLKGGYALRIEDVGSVFIFHGGLILISILITIAESPWRRKRHRKRTERETRLREETEKFEQRRGTRFIRPSMESLHSNKSIRLSDSQRSSLSLDYSYRDDILSAVESPRRTSEDILESIQLMQDKLHKLQHYGETRRKRKMTRTGGMNSPKAARKTVPRLPPVIDDDEEDDSIEGSRSEEGTISC